MAKVDVDIRETKPSRVKITDPKGIVILDENFQKALGTQHRNEIMRHNDGLHEGPGTLRFEQGQTETTTKQTRGDGQTLLVTHTL